MSNRQSHTLHPLDHHLRATPLSGISNSRMTNIEYDRHSLLSRCMASDESEPERPSSLPVKRVLACEPRPSSINIDALDNCMRNMDDYLQSSDER